MRKKLTKHGDDYALLLDKSTLELLQITPETPLELIVDGDAIIVRPVVDEARQAKLDEALAEVNRQYGRALKKLSE